MGVSYQLFVRRRNLEPKINIEKPEATCNQKVLIRVCVVKLNFQDLSRKKE